MKTWLEDRLASAVSKMQVSKFHVFLCPSKVWLNTHRYENILAEISFCFRWRKIIFVSEKYSAYHVYWQSNCCFKTHDFYYDDPLYVLASRYYNQQLTLQGKQVMHQNLFLSYSFLQYWLCHNCSLNSRFIHYLTLSIHNRPLTLKSSSENLSKTCLTHTLGK